MAKRNKAREKEHDPNISGFLGIGEGKVAAAKAAGAVAVEESKRITLALEAKLAAQGYDPKGDAIKTAADAEASSNKTTTYIAIGVVLILMVGLYFIIKIRKR